MSTVDLLKKIRDMAVSRMDRIISEFEESLPEDKLEVKEVKAEGAANEEEDEDEEGYFTVADAAREIPVPGPIGTGVREGVPEIPAETGKFEGKVNKSEMIRGFFEKNPDAGNKDCIEHFGKKGIEIKASLVSIVRGNMGTKKEKRKRGRPAGSVKAGSVKAKAEKKSGVNLAEAALMVMSKSKDGLRVNKILEGVKKYYSYGGDQGDKGLKNYLNVTLNTLSQKKIRRGWKGKMPVVLHDKNSHTWRLNPKAERQTA